MNDRPGWVPCPTCGGSGKADTFMARPLGPKGEFWSVKYDPCPDCSSGWVPSDGLVEAAAKAERVGGDGTGYVGVLGNRWVRARRVLIAADRYEREQEGR